MHSIFIGYDPRETEAFLVATHSILARATIQREALEMGGLYLPQLREAGLYTRPTSKRPNQGGTGGQLWDDISDAPMSTEFAISRFLTPLLSSTKWALFMDCDMLVRADIGELFAQADDRCAVMCVKHQQSVPAVGGIGKMDGQQQTYYARKNWSSVMLFNCRHPAMKKFNWSLVNTLPGRELHRFCWLEDDEIGSLDVSWNWLAGISPASVDPKIAHFTLGVPSIRGYENQPYADEWRAELTKAIAGNVDLGRVQRAKSPAS